MAIDLKLFASALQSRSSDARLVLVMAPRWEIVQALADSPDALAAARVLGWDHPGVRVPDMLAEAEPVIAGRAIDAVMRGGLT
ncbi:MAG: hypothetical protein Q8M80_00930 [Hydrogenophaga sp.]|uniref:hypothetical protein n=1 Tax=Hydrogenophaga sp. TaxID=1904254 RepID=UPI002732AC08|nr:hypothetical protein [Hydrogenophaga sp.]MDP3202611.1 hypothetical protein [Hydrogenophaga sp.]MDP3625410.1 hypothetical protein [Hydrogenophaga sp.]